MHRSYRNYSYSLYVPTHNHIRGPAEVLPLSVAGGARECLSPDGSNLTISPKMSYGVLQCGTVMLPNYTLMIL